MINYIINFLLRDSSLSNLVGYCSKDNYDKYKVIIIPSSFFEQGTFGTEKSLPSLPLAYLNDTPVLYGKPLIEKIDNTIICHSDIIAASFFFLSRYEEFISPGKNLDIHGRYVGASSFSAKANILSSPVVDEYSIFLRNLLKDAGINVPPIKQESKIYLTHDVDTLSLYRRIRGALGGLRRSITGSKTDSFQSVFKSMQNIENDPAFTFNTIINNDKRIPNAEKIYFIKAAKKVIGFDYPGYSLYNKDFKYFSNKVLSIPNTTFGLHTSYQSGENTNLVKYEYNKLQDAVSFDIKYNRWHYLRIPAPTEMNVLHDNGITDDFSVCYADTIAYRLGTTRAVNYINPMTKEVSKLVLHPLSIMDVTLNNYMNLPYDDAFCLCKKTIDTIKFHTGDICLLWHNTSFSSQTYHQELYKKVIDYLL